MKPIVVRGVKIGEGIPKICAPVVGETKAEILAAAEEIGRSGADLAEWRADWYEDVFRIEKVLEVAEGLRDILKEMPLLFTFRTAGEGGEKEIEPETYVNLNKKMAESGCADLIDVELFMGEEVVQELVKTAHENDIKVIASNHDFHATPAKDVIVERLCRMKTLGADIPKIAVMPQNTKDVLTLLEATREMAEEKAEGPIITMSMSGKGVISRISGELFGSAVTFGAVGKISAPGQIAVAQLKSALSGLHKSL